MSAIATVNTDRMKVGVDIAAASGVTTCWACSGLTAAKEHARRLGARSWAKFHSTHAARGSTRHTFLSQVSFFLAEAGGKEEDLREIAYWLPGVAHGLHFERPRRFPRKLAGKNAPNSWGDIKPL